MVTLHKVFFIFAPIVLLYSRSASIFSTFSPFSPFANGLISFFCFSLNERTNVILPFACPENGIGRNNRLGDVFRSLLLFFNFEIKIVKIRPHLN